MSKRVSAAACGKMILFGEHAVVYGRPAMAVPVTQVRATATIEPGGHGLTIHAADVERLFVGSRQSGDPLAAMVRLTLAHMNCPQPDLKITSTRRYPSPADWAAGRRYPRPSCERWRSGGARLDTPKSMRWCTKWKNCIMAHPAVSITR